MRYEKIRCGGTWEWAVLCHHSDGRIVQVWFLTEQEADECLRKYA